MAAIGTLWLIVLGVIVLTILKATTEHISAIIAPKTFVVIGFLRTPTESTPQSPSTGT